MPVRKPSQPEITAMVDTTARLNRTSDALLRARLRANRAISSGYLAPRILQFYFSVARASAARTNVVKGAFNGGNGVSCVR
jgi:hypothetical protein